MAGQADFILAGAKCLNVNRAFLGIGEMGTGKSLMGALIPWVHAKGRPYKALVMSPSHLTKKWPSEILRTVPDARVFVIRGIDLVEERALIKESKKTDIIATWSLEAARNLNDTRPMYFCLSKETAKLSYGWKASFNVKKKIQLQKFYNNITEKTEVKLCRYRTVNCPHCGAVVLDKEGNPATQERLEKVKSKCLTCEAPLWTGSWEGRKPRIAVSEYILKKMKGVFNYFIADEVHELASGQSAQGNSFGQLTEACGKTICLTGTLFGGYSKHIFYILYRIYGKLLKQDGFVYEDLSKFTTTFGCMESRIVLDDVSNRNSKGARKGVITKEKPGLSPVIFGRYLLPICAFLELTDISDALPEYQEDVIVVDTEPELGFAYGKLADEMKKAVIEARRNGENLMGTMLSTLLSYPDYPFLDQPVCSPTGEVLVEPDVLDASQSLPKEDALIDYIKNEVALKRNVLVYTTFHHKRGPHPRIMKRLSELGIKNAYLPSTIKPEDRETWVDEMVASGIKVLITNPECVKTGLDLLAFPTIAFFQPTYNVLTLRQASRRSWRIGQDKNVKVVFFAYKKTIQEMAMVLIGQKMSASMAIEGKFSEEGLQAMNDAEDVSTALARSIVLGTDNKQSIAEVWSELNIKQKGTGVKVDGLVHDVESLVKLGYPKDKAELYLSKFKDNESRKIALERLLKIS